MSDKARNIVILSVIVGIALLLSVLSYQFSVLISNKIVDIASQHVRSNTIIEAHDNSQILANKLQTIGALLQTLAQSPAVHNNEYNRADTVINTRQQFSGNLTDFYMWLNKEGKINWISNTNKSTYQKYKGTDLSYTSYFTVPRDTYRVFYSSLIKSNDKVPRLYISYPVINTTGINTVSTNGIFTGVVVASIRLQTLSNFLSNQLLPQFSSTIGLLDRNGIVLYTNPRQFGITTDPQQYAGEQVFGDKFQSLLASSLHSPDSRNRLNDLIRRSLQGYSGLADILINGKINTIAYQPILVNGKNFLYLYVSAQHNLASDVSVLISLYRYFTVFVVAIIGAVAIIIAFLVFSWNKRLKSIVSTKTAELAESNKELTFANEQLKVHDKMQEEFINIAAHELRTPAQSILGYAELAKIDPGYIERETQSFIDIIYRNAFRIQKLTRDILDVTRIESHTLRLNKTKFSLKEVILNAIEDAKLKLAPEDRTRVKLEFKNKAAEEDDSHINILVQADRERIMQVISNLLNNALKFTSEGLVSVAVARKIEHGKRQQQAKKEEEVVVSIEDTGSGIDPEIYPRLFTKFSSKSFSGTGLGLYISRSIIEAHGGKIWAKNNGQGKCGATFYFSLPLAI
ncbi:MAG: sensor histidine kinase [Candidatus Nitrosopolaris sp.]